MTGACVSAPGDDLTFSRTSINCPLQARHYLRLITRLITTVGGTKTNILHEARRIATRPLLWSAEEQHVAVRIANLEAAETIVGIIKRYAECCSVIGKFDRERIGVWRIDVGIPPHGGITLGVRQRRRVFIGLDEDLRSVATDDGEKRVSIRLLEFRLEAKFAAVKCDGLIDVADDEER